MDKTAVKIITYFDGIEDFLVGLLFFTIPFGWTLSIVPLVLFTITLLVNIFTKPEKPSREKILYFLPLICIFLWNCFTLLYSDDKNEGVQILTTQLALLVAAIAFLFNKITQSAAHKGFYLFLVGCFCSVVSLFGIAIYKSSGIVGDAFIFRPFFEAKRECMLDTDVMGNYFLGGEFSHFVHPAYGALMLSMAMFFILQNIRVDSKNLKNTNFWIFAFALFGLCMIMYSLNGTLVLSIAMILICLGSLSLRKIYYGDLNRIIYAILFLFTALIIVNPQTIGISGSDECSSLEHKIEITKASLNVVGENWLTGVGIGDEKNALFEQYKTNGQEMYASRKLNSHNQFLTTWIQSGIIGLLLLIWSLVALYIRGHKVKRSILFLFGTVVFISFMFESMLVRYSGVMTYSIFYGMLYFYTEKENKAKNIIVDE